VYNDAVFTEGDFTSLKRLGDSGKIKDKMATGKFGLGFNSVLRHAVPANSRFMDGPTLRRYSPEVRLLLSVLIIALLPLGRAKALRSTS
jgi:hypothetical protein